MTIADTIKSLKPGDQVRVTFEDEVVSSLDGGTRIEVRHFGYVLRANNNTITSIEVIQRPLQVGDAVICWGNRGATIKAIVEDYALIQWSTGLWDNAPLSDLRRAS